MWTTHLQTFVAAYAPDDKHGVLSTVRHGSFRNFH